MLLPQAATSQKRRAHTRRQSLAVGICIRQSLRRLLHQARYYYANGRVNSEPPSGPTRAPTTPAHHIGKMMLGK